MDCIVWFVLECITNRDRKQTNISERKVYRRILGPIYDNEKEYNREEWKELLRTARNRRILHMPMELILTHFIECIRWLI
jgi:hypothetical protein